MVVSTEINFLDEYLGKQARSTDKEKILNIIKELNNKGIFFIIIDGKIYVSALDDTEKYLGMYVKY